MKLIFHPLAEKEYTEAYHWYEKQVPGLGDRFSKSLDKKIAEILKHPERYPKKQSNFRETSTETFPYLIVYEYLNNISTIHISAIYHARRNPKRKYRRGK